MSVPETEIRNMNDRKENNHRRSNKPLMERRRRERINTCLGELKSLILQAMKKENSQFSKLEKADILEMTVKYLRHVQRSQLASAITGPTIVAKYQTGFGECAQEVMKCLDGFQGMGKDLQCRLSQHLSQRMFSMPLTQASMLLTNPAGMQLLQPMHAQIPGNHIGNLAAVPSVGGIPPPHAHQSQLNFAAENTTRIHMAGSFYDYRKPETVISPSGSRSPVEAFTSDRHLINGTLSLHVTNADEKLGCMSRASPVSPEYRISSASSSPESASAVAGSSRTSVQHNTMSNSHKPSNKFELDARFPNAIHSGFSHRRRSVPIECATVSGGPSEENVWRPW